MFTNKDEEAVIHPFEYVLIVNVTSAGYELNRALVDEGSSINVLFKQTLDGLEISDLRLNPIKKLLK